MPPVRDGFEDPVRSDVPALVPAGEHDPVTPPAHGRSVARDLTRAPFVGLPALGHGVVRSQDCGATLLRAFVANPSADVGTSCVEAMGPPAWVLP